MPICVLTAKKIPFQGGDPGPKPPPPPPPPPGPPGWFEKHKKLIIGGAIVGVVLVLIVVGVMVAERRKPSDLPTESPASGIWETEAKAYPEMVPVIS